MVMMVMTMVTMMVMMMMMMMVTVIMLRCCYAPGHGRERALNNTTNNKRPLTPKSMPPAGDEHAKLKT